MIPGIPLPAGTERRREPNAATAASSSQTGDREPTHYTPDSSRRARCAEVRRRRVSSGLDALFWPWLVACVSWRNYCGSIQRKPGFKVLNEVVLTRSSCPSEMTDHSSVINEVQVDGTCWWLVELGGRENRKTGVSSVSSWMATREDVERSQCDYNSARKC